MRHLTDGERDTLAEQEADARDIAEPDAGEHELSAGDWAEVGHCDGYTDNRHWPPRDPDLARHYTAGFNAGRYDRRTDDATPPNPSPAAGEDSEIPF